MWNSSAIAAIVVQVEPAKNKCSFQIVKWRGKHLKGLQHCTARYLALVLGKGEAYRVI